MAAFDATQSATFTFNVLGGSQVAKNRLYIKQGSTVIYSGLQTTYSFTHVLPANTLTNGQNYTAYVITYDTQGEASVSSNTISFACYTTPTFVLSTIDTSKSTITFTIHYNQAQNETLSSYEFNLFDTNGRLLNSSKVIQTGNPTMTASGLYYSYTFTGFINNTTYYIEVLGQTAGGTQLSTGKVRFLVRYEKPSVYQQLQLVNNCEQGNITISSQATAIIGETNPTPPVYVDGNTAIYLYQQGAYVRWSDGVSIDGNWTMGIWGRSFVYNKTVAFMTSITNDNIVITLVSDGDFCTAMLTVNDYVVLSNSIAAPTLTDNLYIWVRCIDNLYDIVLAKLE